MLVIVGKFAECKLTILAFRSSGFTSSMSGLLSRDMRALCWAVSGIMDKTTRMLDGSFLGIHSMDKACISS